MPLFNCENCGVVENTALSPYWVRNIKHVVFDWKGKEHLKGKALCSECAPTHYADGKPTKYGVWHGKFEKQFKNLEKS